jgi:hypothetical protein
VCSDLLVRCIAREVNEAFDCMLEKTSEASDCMLEKVSEVSNCMLGGTCEVFDYILEQAKHLVACQGKHVQHSTNFVTYIMIQVSMLIA